MQFNPAPEREVHAYRTGDYWIFAVRAGTGQIEGPTPHPDRPEIESLDTAMPPYGITDHNAPIALISNKKDGEPLIVTDPSPWIYVDLQTILRIKTVDLLGAQ